MKVKKKSACVGCVGSYMKRRLMNQKFGYSVTFVGSVHVNIFLLLHLQNLLISVLNVENNISHHNRSLLITFCSMDYQYSCQEWIPMLG